MNYICPPGSCFFFFFSYLQEILFKMVTCLAYDFPCVLYKWTLSEVKVTQSCSTLWDPMGYTFHGSLQARILEWVAFPFSRGSSQPRDWTQVSCIAGGFFTSQVIRESLQVLLDFRRTESDLTMMRSWGGGARGRKKEKGRGGEGMGVE